MNRFINRYFLGFFAGIKFEIPGPGIQNAVEYLQPGNLAIFSMQEIATFKKQLGDLINPVAGNPLRASLLGHTQELDDFEQREFGYKSA